MKASTTVFFSLVIRFTSCKGQNKSAVTSSNGKETEMKITIGETVSELDKNIGCIFQDKNNTYWFGSYEQGLYRYDGKTILHFTTKEGLLDNQIRGIQEDESGNIFISSLGGINKFDGQVFTSLPIVESKEWKMEPNDLWFSILGKKEENGTYRYDGKNLYHLKFPKQYLEDEFYSKFPNATFNPYEVYSIYKDSKGAIWFGTANFGLCRYDGTSLSWLYEDHLTNTPSGGSFGIRSILEDSKGSFWICNTQYRYEMSPTHTVKNGMNYIDYKRKKGMGKVTNNNQEEYPYFFSIIEDNEGALWMTTYDQGVFQFKDDKLIQYPIKEQNTIVNTYTLYKDKQNNIWLGTLNAGVYKYTGKTFEKFKP